MFLSQTVPEGHVFALDKQMLIGTGIQFLNGVILTVVLALILYKPVKEFMEKRTDKIQGDIDKSELTMEKANELIAEYEYKIENIDKEYEKVLQEARVEAADARKVILEEAHKEANRIKKRSEGIIESERERMKLETRPYIIELATLMAESYIADNIEKEEQEKIFNEALAKLEEAQWQR